MEPVSGRARLHLTNSVRVQQTAKIRLARYLRPPHLASLDRVPVIIILDKAT